MRTVFPIRNMAGELIAEHVRVDLPGGKKQMYWQTPGCDPRDGLMGMSTPDLPLYGSEYLPALATGETVVVVEGERARDALWALGFNAVATVTGTSSVPGEDALSVLLPFDVVLWPDHDRVGHQHMNRAAWTLHRLGGHLPRAIVPSRLLRDGTRVHWVRVQGHDAADLDPRANRERIVRRLIDAATTWDLRQEAQKLSRVLRPIYDHAGDADRVEAARSNLLRVVEERLGPPKEVRQGTPWWCCPFHADRSPSFKVDTRQPFYRCFGCPARGDVFTFLRSLDGAGFKDALQELAPAPVSIRTVKVWSLGTGDAIGR